MSRPATTITLDAARAVLDAGVAAAESSGTRMCLAVTDPSGTLVAFARMDGSFLISVDVAREKAWTACAAGIPTHEWSALLASNPALAALGKGKPFVPVPGGIPLLVDGEMIGALGVSGGTADEDLAVAEAAAAAVGLGS